MSKQPDVRVIPMKSIRENPVALRSVDRDSEDFAGLRDSILTNGLLSPVSVRIKMEDDVETFELVDGLNRYSACCDIGLKVIPVLVKDLTDSQTLEAQVIANVHRIVTKPVEYTKQLQRIFAANPTLTLTEMAVKIAKSASWVSQRLSLLRLEKTIKVIVDDGQICVSNAVQLAKLPAEEQLNFVEQAMSMESGEFVPMVQARVKELRDAARQGRSSEPQAFVALPRMQKMAVMKKEHETPTLGPQLCKKYRVKTGPEGFALGIAFALSLDPANIEVRTADDARKRASLADAKNKRAAERATKKAELAKSVAEAAIKNAEAVT